MVDLALGAVGALADAAGDVAEALARDPEAQRIATEARGRLRLERMNNRNKRRWYRCVQAACEDLADAREDGDSAEAHAAVLRLLTLGVSGDMLRLAVSTVEALP